MNKGIFFKLLIFIFGTVNAKMQPLKQSPLGHRAPETGERGLRVALGATPEPGGQTASMHVKPGVDVCDWNASPLSLCLSPPCARELRVAVGRRSTLQATRRGASVGQAQPDPTPDRPRSQPARVRKAAGAQTRGGGQPRARRVRLFSWAWQRAAPSRPHVRPSTPSAGDRRTSALSCGLRRR